MTIKDVFFLILALVFLSACSTAPKSTISSPVYLIESKAQIKNLRKDDSHNAKIEIILLENQAIRMEVTAMFGYAIASIVMTPQKIQYALHTSKKFAEGPFTGRTLYPVFKQNIDPRILWNSIHNKNPEGAGLKCTVDASGLPLECTGPNDVTVTYVYESPVKRRIDIKNPQFQMLWVFKDQRPYESAQNETFVLKKPDEYQQIQIK